MVYLLVAVVSAGGFLCQFASAGSPPALPPDPSVSEALLQRVGDGYRIRETDHFTIAYDTNYTILRALTGRLEATYNAVWEFCEGEGLSQQAPQARLAVILFDSFEAYQRSCKVVGMDPQTTAGFYDHGTNTALFSNMHNRPALRQVTVRIEQITDRLARIRRNRSSSAGSRSSSAELRRELKSLQARRDAAVKRYNRLIIQHESAHQMLFNVGVHRRGGQNPDWLVEGLACQFEVSQRWSPKGLQRVNQDRLSDFREVLGAATGEDHVPVAGYRAALNDGRLLPLRELIGDAAALKRGHPQTAYHYAQAWSFVFYLQRRRHEAFVSYIRLISQRRPQQVPSRMREIRDFEKTFGPIDDELERGWLSHTLALRHEPQR